MTKEQKQQWLFRVVLILAFIGLMIAYFKTEIAASNRQAIRKALREMEKAESAASHRGTETQRIAGKN